MAHPARNAASADILNPSRIFFATTKTSMDKRLLQSERNATFSSMYCVRLLRASLQAARFRGHARSVFF